MDYIMFVCLRSSILMLRPVEYNFTVFGLLVVVEEDRMVVRNSEQVVHNPELVVRIVALLLCTPLSG
jgi:hypothetical protein